MMTREVEWRPGDYLPLQLAQATWARPTTLQPEKASNETQQQPPIDSIASVSEERQQPRQRKNPLRFVQRIFSHREAASKALPPQAMPVLGWRHQPIMR